MGTHTGQNHTGLRVEAVEDSSMGTHTGPTSHWVEGGDSWRQLYGDTYWTNITLGWGWKQLKTALWGHILDQHHTGLRVEIVEESSMGTHTGPTSHWVEGGDSWRQLYGDTHRPTSHWVEGGGSWRQLYGNTYWTNITLGWGWRQLKTALWGHILDQHHTGLRVEAYIENKNWMSIGNCIEKYLRKDNNILSQDIPWMCVST